MKKFVLLTKALLFAGILCACGDSTQVDISADTTVVDSAVNDNSVTQTTAEEDVLDGLMYYSYYSDLSGYKVLGYDQAGGKEYHRLFHTSDGGKTWNEIDTNIDTVYLSMVTSISFLNESIGFLTYRYYDFDFNPAILLTIDGGATWTRLTKICELLSDYSFQGYLLEASAPLFKDDVCYIQIKGIRHNDNDVSDDIINLTIMSEDYDNWIICQ